MNPTYVVVGRQPVFDRNLLITGYELLFRSTRSARVAGSGTSGDEMTATVFSSALSIGLQRLVGTKDIYCNADRGVLSGAVPLLLPPERTTIEIAPDTPFDAEIEHGCRILRETGFRLALDDYSPTPTTQRLLPLVDAVKIDVARGGLGRALDIAGTVAELAAGSGDGPPLRIAHKIETERELDACLAAGFDLLQGFALARPTTMTGAQLEASALGALQLSSAVLDLATDMEEIERVIRRDPALTVQLLEIASVGDLGGFRRTVRSIRDALVLIGSQRLRSWVALLLLRSQRATSPDELITVLSRARIAEMLATPDEAAFAFTAGMISGLDRFLGIPADELAGILPLDDELLAAAFYGTGPVGQLVQRVIRHEAQGGTDLELEELIRPALDWAVQSAELLELG